MVKKFLKQYEILLKKATVDLNAAKVILVSFEKGEVELELEVIFFHIQQGVEKLIKALLDFHKLKFPHTHDLKDLIDLLDKNDINPIKDVDSIVRLTGYAIEGRYSIIHDDLNDTDKYIQILEELLLSVTTTIHKKS